jgi:hypothetical protein
MRFAKDKKADFDERNDKDDTPKKEWAPAKSSTMVTKIYNQMRNLLIHYFPSLVPVDYCVVLADLSAQSLSKTGWS